MNPNYDTLRNARDFLSRLLDLPPKEAIDALANNGEDMVFLFNAALGKEAFKVGDTVMAFPEDGEEFEGTIVSVRRGSEGEDWLFGVKDQDNDVFDCEAHEILPSQKD